MKPISLTKTMPWLLGASAVFTLAFSQNVFANTNGNPQATSIKQVNKANINQANTNNLNLRMLYLNTSAKATLLNPGAKSPTNDGLGDALSNHNNVNAYLYKPAGAMPEDEFFDYSIQYLIGNPKLFNDPSLKSNKTQALSDPNYASFHRDHWKTVEEAKNDIRYRPAEDLQNNPQIDLGNGVKAYKTVNVLHGEQYWYYLTLYQGKYQVDFYTISNKQDDSQAWKSLTDQAKSALTTLKSASLPKTDSPDSHGNISVSVDSPNSPKSNSIQPINFTDISWQEENYVYHSLVPDLNGVINPISTNLKMVESVK